MILVDTSVWIDHLRFTNRRLKDLLEQSDVRCHPFVVGEMACGNLKPRKQVLDLLDRLPKAALAEDAEVRELVERRSLHGNGLGWVDVHLIASALIGGDQIWTLDRALANASESLGLGA